MAENILDEKNKSKPTIKHMVISGGGHTIYCSCGAIEKLLNDETIHYSNLESIYATSAGGLVATIICLKFDWETIKDYLIKRPWHEVYYMNVNDILGAYSKRGIYDKKYFEILFKPLFSAKDISMNITLKEFYEHSNIEIHLFSLELHDFKVIDISYKTHPDLELLTALHMSCAFPVIFSPCVIEDKCYVDGGIIMNYPLQACMDDGHILEEIIGFKNEYVCDDENNTNIVNENSTILDYITCFLYKLVDAISTERKQTKIPHEIIYKISNFSLFSMTKVMGSQELRLDLWKRGVNAVLENLG
jgi:predicted acylesterase/phospholipase RssA